MSATALTSTTLSANTSGNPQSNTVNVTSATGIAAGSVLCVGSELMLVTGVAGTGLTVQRGYDGTQSQPHLSGAIVYAGTASSFKVSQQFNMGSQRVAAAQVTGQFAMPDLALPTGSRVIDPNTGFEYVVVDCQSALTIGEWVGIDGNGLGTTLSTATKGRVGIIVETIGSSDTLALAIVVGTFASALFSSSVTTAVAQLLADAQYPTLGTSAGGNVIFNATCTVAPSTATSPGGLTSAGVGTAYIYNPWCMGATVDLVP